MDERPARPAAEQAPVPAQVSFWWEAAGRPRRRRSLPGDIDCDVAIVGAGYTGLWTAYYLARRDPSLRIAVIEARHAGFGASGRNGGWMSGHMAMSSAMLAEPARRDGVLRLREAITRTVDEALAVIAAENIDADALKSGNLRVAVTPAQEARLRASVAQELSLGATEHDVRIVEAGELGSLINVAGALVGAYTPHCARVQPAKLAAGLADAAERHGVTIYEDTMVTVIEPGVVRTRRGSVRAPVVVRATEGFTARLPGQARRWLPMNSSMIVTQPIPGSVWDQIGWQRAETLSDLAHAYVYLQRTTDDRIAIGGRGRPYAFGNGFDPAGTTPAQTSAALARILRGMFPPLAEVAIEWCWSGVLGVPRDWNPSVGFDRQTGLAWAGGYVGQGVATANLAGRTLTDLITGTTSDLTGLPWVGHASQDWEPEPLRWLGVQAMYAAYRYADRREASAPRPRSALVARIADRIAGR